MNIHIIRVDGTEVDVDCPRIRELAPLIGATMLDGFSLRDGRYCYVDDTGMVDGRPVNAKATALYRSICKPDTPHQIHGDVAIVADDGVAA